MTEETLKSREDYVAPNLRGRPGRMPPEESAQITRKVTALAVTIGLFFAISKFFIYQETQSIGILSSLIHSALDVFASISTFVAVRYAVQKPGASYKFGHGKAESFAAVLQVCLIVVAAAHLMTEALTHLENPEPVERTGLAIGALVVFIFISIGLLMAQGWAIRATGSIAVRGDRAHYLADMLANMFVIAGILFASYTPLKRADTVVGILMGLWLLFTAIRISRIAWAQLMDQELPHEERDLIIKLAMQDKAVRAVHDLRTRASGPHIHIQMRLDLDAELSLSQAHDVILEAEQRMMQVYKAADILIHPHPTGCHATHGNIRFRGDD